MNHNSPSLVLPRSTFASRRDFLRRAGAGFGSLALTSLLQDDAGSAYAATAPAGVDRRSFEANPLRARPSHFPAKAKSVIWLFMHGAPSQVDTWDYKPDLNKHDGQELVGFDQSTGFFAGTAGPIMKSPFKFRQHGQTGTWVSDIFPHMARHVDDMALVYSCYAKANNHSPAQFHMNTGRDRMGLPCVGSWVTYGLGTENQNLPGFIVMYDSRGRGLPKSRASSWGAGFLPGSFQGTAVKGQWPPIDNLQRPEQMTDKQQQAQLELISRLNRRHLKQNPHESELAARIKSFELAYRMQVTAPDALNVNSESAATQRLYGLDNPRCSEFGKQVLFARRLVERGVRFVQIYSGGNSNEDCWDAHANVAKNHTQFAGETDRPIAGLLSDLKQRGLLDSTLVIWCGEFGRLPLVQKGGKSLGRDHNPAAFTMWMAGGGVKAGARYGKTDELGNKAVQQRVSINDLHATILHLLGMDHKKLTYRHTGRDYRLTDVAGKVVHNVIA